MNDEKNNLRLLHSVRLLVVSAEEESTTLKALYTAYQLRLNALNSSRRKLLFSGNEADTIANIVSLINEIELVKNDLEASKIHLSTLLSSALSYLVCVIENNQSMNSMSMHRLINEIRKITELVQDTKSMNVDYSTLSSLVIRGSILMTMKEKDASTGITIRLFDVLKNAII